jgi:hypothetical protein
MSTAEVCGLDERDVHNERTTGIPSQYVWDIGILPSHANLRKIYDGMMADSYPVPPFATYRGAGGR